MSALPVRPDGIDVERIMEQIRARVEERSRREAVEAERESAPDADSERDRRVAEPERENALVALPPSESFAFHGNSIYWSSRGRGVGQLLHASRRLLAPLLKFVFNIDPMVDALATQARRNVQQAAFDDDVARRLAAREEQDALNRRAVESLTVEMERLAADMKRHRTLVASAVERLDALEQGRAGEHAAKPPGDRQTDERPDDARPSPPADETPPPSDRQADEHPDDDLPASPPAAAPPTPNR
jgi:hypothetical protein